MNPADVRIATIWLLAGTFCIAGLLSWAWLRDTGAPSESCPVALARWDTALTGKAAQETEIWIEVEGNRIRVAEARSLMTLSDLKRLVALHEQFKPRPYLKLDLTRATDCAFATKVRDAVAAVFPCDEANCWQGSRAAFSSAKWNPAKPLIPW